MSGVSASLLKHLTNRRGNPGIATLLKIANATGLSIDDLVGRRIDAQQLRALTASATRRYPIPEEVAAAMLAHIRTSRARKGWSCAEFARRSGLRRNTVHDLENQKLKPSLTTMERVARTFDLSVGAFIEGAALPLRTSDSPVGWVLDLTEYSLGTGGSIRVSPPAQRTTMLHVLSGSVLLSMGARRRVLSEGNAIQLADGPHTVANTGTSPARFLMFKASP